MEYKTGAPVVVQQVFTEQEQITRLCIEVEKCLVMLSALEFAFGKQQPWALGEVRINIAESRVWCMRAFHVVRGLKTS